MEDIIISFISVHNFHFFIHSAGDAGRTRKKKMNSARNVKTMMPKNIAVNALIYNEGTAPFKCLCVRVQNVQY